MHPQSVLETGKALGQTLPGRTAVLVIGWHVDEILFAKAPLGLTVRSLRLGHDRANTRLLTGEDLFALKVPSVSNHAEFGAPALSGDQTLGEERWQDAHILPAREDWGGGLSGGRLPGMPLLFDPKTGRPSQWPLRYTMAHWTAELPPLERGTYTLRCRSIDNTGIAQPMPRPFAKSGRVDIHEVTLVVA